MPKPPQDHKNHDQRVFIYLFIYYLSSIVSSVNTTLINQQIDEEDWSSRPVSEGAGWDMWVTAS